jgi:hypothetical protein
MVAVAVVVGLGTAAETIPSFEAFRIFTSRSVEAEPPELLATDEQRLGETELKQETRDRPDLGQPEHAEVVQARGPIPEGERDLPNVANEPPPVSIVDPNNALAPFYESLERSQRKQDGAITRILYYGDSLVASDYVTGTLRRKLQEQFGDSGHGFVLMANAWPAYFHNDVYRSATGGFVVSRVVGPYVEDGLYGLGGVSFKAPIPVRAEFGTAKKGSFGRAVDHFEIAYLKQPKGGSLRVSVDGKLALEIPTSSERIESAFASLEVSDGEHVFDVLTAGPATRTFGVVLERKRPGVVLDALGIQGARIRFLDKQDDAHWAEQLRWRKPNLLAFHFGANESGDGYAYSMEDYHETMKAVLLQAKTAVPEAGCLIVGALDRARKVDDGMITVPVIPLIVEEQRKTALEVGCAFWNTFEAMGGRGSMAKWVRRGLGQADLTHPTGVGAERLGTWIYRALLEGYDRHRAGEHAR